MGLSLLQMHGRITDGTGSTSPQVEIWSCSLACDIGSGTDIGAAATAAAAAINTWFSTAATRIHTTVTLDGVKLNRFDIATGHQTTDPTNEFIFSTPIRGASTSYTPALTTSYKLSLDTGTRDRKTKGGFFVPRSTMPIQNSGRFSGTDAGDALATAATLMGSLVSSAGLTPGVWSRADKSFSTSTRLRIGDVPDNIRRRKNDLVENYLSVAL